MDLNGSSSTNTSAYGMDLAQMGYMAGDMNAPFASRYICREYFASFAASSHCI
jgi:hypothetical protein